MITNTHLLMSRVLFKYCSKKLDTKLNKFNFLYGNIKPDFTSGKSNYHHCMDESMDVVCDYCSQLINTKMSIKTYSLTLGIVCHLICDYFCLYHTKEYRDKSLFEHFMYEVRLHFASINIFIFKRSKITMDTQNVSEKSIPDIIYHMHEKYSMENKSYFRDIVYAVSTAMMVMDLIVNKKNLGYSSFENIRKVS